MMGTMVRQTGKQTMRRDVGRGDVQNHQTDGFELYGFSRLPIGHFELHTVGSIEGGDMQLDLWNAEVRERFEQQKELSSGVLSCMLKIWSSLRSLSLRQVRKCVGGSGFPRR